MQHRGISTTGAFISELKVTKADNNHAKDIYNFHQERKYPGGLFSLGCEVAESTTSSHNTSQSLLHYKWCLGTGCSLLLSLAKLLHTPSLPFHYYVLTVIQQAKNFSFGVDLYFIVALCLGTGVTAL